MLTRKVLCCFLFKMHMLKRHFFKPLLKKEAEEQLDKTVPLLLQLRLKFARSVLGCKELDVH